MLSTTLLSAVGGDGGRDCSPALMNPGLAFFPAEDGKGESGGGQLSHSHTLRSHLTCAPVITVSSTVLLRGVLLVGEWPG